MMHSIAESATEVRMADAPIVQRDSDCLEALAKGGLLGRPGPVFGMTQHHARLELLMREDTFDKAAAKLAKLAVS